MLRCVRQSDPIFRRELFTNLTKGACSIMSTTILAVNHTDSSDADLPAVLPEATSLPESAEAFGVATPSMSVTATGNNNIDGLLIGSKPRLNQVHVENRSSGPPFGKQATPPAPLPNPEKSPGQ